MLILLLLEDMMLRIMVIRNDLVGVITVVVGEELRGIAARTVGRPGVRACGIVDVSCEGVSGHTARTSLTAATAASVVAAFKSGTGRLGAASRRWPRS